MGGSGPQAAQAMAWGVTNFPAYISREKKLAWGAAHFLAQAAWANWPIHPVRCLSLHMRAANDGDLDEPVCGPFPQL